MSNLIDRLRVIFGRRSRLHMTAHEYWRSCSNTFLAGDPTYYDRQEIALREMLKGIALHPSSALDVGCGNGRFSFVIAENIPRVVAFDLSGKLIEEAKATAYRRHVQNIEFEARNLEDGFPRGVFEIVACMGVTSTLIDEKAFTGLIDQLHQSVSDEGHLITKDSLSAEADRSITSGPYITIYRAVSRYKQQFAAAGFVLLNEHQLAAENGLINHLYLWKK